MPRIVSWPLTFLPRFVAEKFIRSNSRLGTVFAIKSLIFKRKENLKNFFKMNDYIICVSQWLYDVITINECSRPKIYIIRHGLPHNYKSELANHLERNKRNKGFLIIGYLGRFHYIKGVHILIKAIKKLPRTMSVKLKLYGSASNKEEEVYLDKLKKEAAGDYRIQFRGRLKPKDKNSFFKGINILAIPSLWFEAGPLVALESFFHKVPVIGSNLGGIAELVKDKKNGILIEPGNINQWAKKIKNIYHDRDFLRNISKNIPEVKSIEDMVKQNIAIYEKALSKR